MYLVARLVHIAEIVQQCPPVRDDERTLDSCCGESSVSRPEKAAAVAPDRSDVEDLSSVSQLPVLAYSAKWRDNRSQLATL
jgi:hypothetical protein